MDWAYSILHRELRYCVLEFQITQRRSAEANQLCSSPEFPSDSLHLPKPYPQQSAHIETLLHPWSSSCEFYPPQLHRKGSSAHLHPVTLESIVPRASRGSSLRFLLILKIVYCPCCTGDAMSMLTVWFETKPVAKLASSSRVQNTST